MANNWEQIVNEEHRKKADSVLLSISTDNGHHGNYAIQIENHSKYDIEVTGISLWSNGQKISKDAGGGWSVPAQRSALIQFDAQEDVAYRLWQLAGSPGATARRFQIEVVVTVRCKVFGLERHFEEARAVQVDLLNHQITGL
jgi:hypothetical protein